MTGKDLNWLALCQYTVTGKDLNVCLSVALVPLRSVSETHSAHCWDVKQPTNYNNKWQKDFFLCHSLPAAWTSSFSPGTDERRLKGARERQ